MTTTEKRRGRPASFDKGKALQVATELFHRKGYDGVGIAELSAAMGIKPPSLYSAFGNKASLFAQTLQGYAASDGQFMAQAFAGADDVKAGLRAMLIAAARQYRQDPARAGCMVMENAHCTTDAQAALACKEMQAATSGAIAAFIAQEYPAKAEAATQQIVIALSGLSASAKMGSPLEALEKFAELTADMIIEELKA